MSWECKKCGACCKTPMTKFWLPEFWDDEKNQCGMLLDNNICAIYNNRPEQCQDIDFSKLPRGEDFRKVYCEFLDKHINHGGENEK